MKAVGDLASFARNASAQLVEQAGDLKDATVEKFGSKKLDPYEEAVVDYDAALAALSKGAFAPAARKALDGPDRARRAGCIGHRPHPEVVRDRRPQGGLPGR